MKTIPFQAVLDGMQLKIEGLTTLSYAQDTSRVQESLDSYLREESSKIYGIMPMPATVRETKHLTIVSHPKKPRITQGSDHSQFLVYEIGGFAYVRELTSQIESYEDFGEEEVNLSVVKFPRRAMGAFEFRSGRLYVPNAAKGAAIIECASRLGSGESIVYKELLAKNAIDDLLRRIYDYLVTT